MGAIARIQAQAREATRFAPVRPAIGSGLRAAISTIVPLLVGHYLGMPAIASWGSLGGFSGSLADKGGAYRSRAAVMGAFALAGSLACMTGSLAGRHPVLALLLVVPLFVLCSLARVYGAGAASVGASTAVTFAVALAAPAPDFHAALLEGAAVFYGAVWAMVVSLVFWPVRQYKPARMATARLWHALARHAERLAEPASGDGQILAERFAIRERIEEARGVLAATRRGRQANDPRGDRLVVLVENADQMLGILVALGDLLENLPGGVPASHAEVLRAVAKGADEIAGLLEGRETGVPTTPAELMGLLRAASTGSESSAFAVRLLRRLAAHVDTSAEAAWQMASGDLRRKPAAPPTRREREDLLEPLRLNLDPRSEMLRHALRVGITALVATWITQAFSIDHGYWITITALVILQPYTAATFQKGMQRIVGTVLGGVITALIATQLHGPVALYTVVFVLAAGCVAVLPINYGVYSILLTPTFVLLAEVSTGNVNLPWVRIALTAFGGLLAFLAARLLWPTWERQRFPEEMARGLREIAAWLREVEHGGSPAALGAARRKVGVSLLNADASFQRLLSESRGSGADVEPALALITYARRFHGTAVSLAGTPRQGDQEWMLRVLAQRAADALEGIADAVQERREPPPLPELPHLPGESLFAWQLDRFERQLSIVRNAAERTVRMLPPPRVQPR